MADVFSAAQEIECNFYSEDLPYQFIVGDYAYKSLLLTIFCYALNLKPLYQANYALSVTCRGDLRDLKLILRNDKKEVTVYVSMVPICN